MTTKSALASAAVLALGALTLTACGSADAQSPAAKSTAASPAASKPAEAPAATDGGAQDSGTGTTGTTAGTTGSAGTTTGSTGGTGTKSGGTTTGTTGTATGSGDATSDSYAYRHPCAGAQITVRVSTRSGHPTQRVIAVRNTGAKSCGLSYYPLVSIGSSDAQERSGNITPLIPGGLGGAPAYALYAGQTAYAVLDLDPEGGASGAGLDELNVLADGEHLPDAETKVFPLDPGAAVMQPRLGLYRATVADAAASAAGANVQS
ncbi:DUF4232 domain-containing protein [Streptomyces polyrhachis]|uniref:DUF4232 domain-containing protein n=1 Tax=Streptomyces polyrhachis TaxID=1282885 RepID=A0ABW2GHY6_9ACTN